MGHGFHKVPTITGLWGTLAKLLKKSKKVRLYGCFGLHPTEKTCSLSCYFSVAEERDFHIINEELH